MPKNSRRKNQWEINEVHLLNCPGGGGIAVRERQIQIAKHCGKIAVELQKIAGKRRCRNQTSRSLKEQHFCTGDTQGTNEPARWTSEKQLRKIAKNCQELRTSAPLNLLGIALLIYSYSPLVNHSHVAGQPTGRKKRLRGPH